MKVYMSFRLLPPTSTYLTCSSKSEKVKLLKEYQEAYNKLDESADEKETDKVFEKAQKIFEITKELEKRSWDGDEKASKEIEEWNKLVIEMNIEF